MLFIDVLTPTYVRLCPAAQTIHIHFESDNSKAFLQSAPIYKISKLQRLKLERQFEVARLNLMYCMSCNLLCS